MQRCTRTGSRFTALIALVGAGGIALTGLPAIADGAVAITAVNGAPVTGGEMPVSGTTLDLEGTAALPPAHFVDAGDSVVVPVGGTVRLTGFAAGSTGALTYDWSAPAGSFANAEEGLVDFVAPATPGTVVATLAATDAATSETATDTVAIVVYAPGPRAVLDMTRRIRPALPDETAGPSGRLDAQQHEYAFDVPAGATDLVATLEWGDALHDLDLKLRGPDPAYATIVTGASSAKPELVNIAAPAPGRYFAGVEGYLNAEDVFDLTVTVVAPPEPLPRVATPGPFRFVAGEAQVLRASSSGGTGAHTVRWDIDGDGRFEATPAPDGTARSYFGLGTHLVTTKVVDGAGFEHRVVTPVRVVPPNSYVDETPFVVIAINDSGLNPYHDEFSASTYPDPRLLAATANFTKHPSEYLTGYPAGTPSLGLTIDGNYNAAADAATLNAMSVGALYWIPGTKIVGAVDSGDASFANGAGDTRPFVDDDGHGTASASVAVGNMTGFCPTCLLFAAESGPAEEPYTYSWVDIVSNSWSQNPLIDGLDTTLGTSVVTKDVVERGQTVLFAAGNGNEGAFVTPNNTYATGTTGPDWIVRVGAANSVSGKPILGDGNPVDVTSFGDGPIPAANHTSASGLTNHSGTSSATPYTAGVFGTVLSTVRERIGDRTAGHRDNGVVARGAVIARSRYLNDGVLTRAELWEAVLKTAAPNRHLSYHPGFATVPFTPYHYMFEGYGLADPASAQRASELLLGLRPLPDRRAEDEFLAADAGLRLRLFGAWAGFKPAYRYSGGAPTPAGPRSDMNKFAGTVMGDVTKAGHVIPLLVGSTGKLPPPTGSLVTKHGIGLAINAPAAGAVVDSTRQAALPVTGTISRPSSQRVYLRQDDCGVNMRLSATDDAAGTDPDCLNLAHSVMGTSLLWDFFVDEFPLEAASLPIAVAGDRPVTGVIKLGSEVPQTVTVDVRLLSGTTVLGEQRVTKDLKALSVTGLPFSFRAARKTNVPLNELKVVLSLQRASAPVTTYMGSNTSLIDIPLGTPDFGRVQVAVDDPTFAGSPAFEVAVARDGTWGHNLATSSLAPGDHTLTARWLPTGSSTPVPDLVTTVDITVTPSAGPFTGVEVSALPAGAPASARQWFPAVDVSGGGSVDTWSGSLSTPDPVGTLYDVRARVVVDDVIVAESAPAAVRRTA